MTHSEHHHAENHGEDWEGIYDAEQVWSGNPNDALVTAMGETLADLAPGRALDVGCGEGADAVWLASQGWRVTAVDVAEAALARGREAAQQADERLSLDVSKRIEWVCSDITTAGLADGSFDLVSACYPALRKDSAIDPCATLISLVAPGGALLFLAHAEVDRERALAHGFDPDDYVTGDDVAAALGPGWSVERWNSERHVAEGRGAHHDRDAVLVARRA